MQKTVLITGASSGIGRATAQYFIDQGWNVAATMRKPSGQFSSYKNALELPLDVTSEKSIAAAVKKTIAKFGEIDVIVNNAGYGLIGPFEAMTPEQLQHQFDVNVFGCMNVIRAVLPHFRERASGTIINVTSMGGKFSLPLYSAYHATKFAMEGFSESLQYELEPFNIAVKVVEPGAIKTDFYESEVRAEQKGLTAYDAFAQKRFQKATGIKTSDPYVIAQAIFKAATDESSKMRYVAGAFAPLLLTLRKLLPDRLFFWVIRQAT